MFLRLRASNCWLARAGTSSRKTSHQNSRHLNKNLHVHRLHGNAINCQRLKTSPAFSFKAPAWRRFRAPALLATVNARTQRDPARPSQRPASSNAMVPTLPPRFAILQPEHCAPAQHKPKILNNELSNNSPSCLRSILASASSMQLKEGKRNSSATTPRQLKPQNRGTGTRSRRSRGPGQSKLGGREATRTLNNTAATLKLLQTAKPRSRQSN